MVGLLQPNLVVSLYHLVLQLQPDKIVIGYTLLLRACRLVETRLFLPFYSLIYTGAVVRSLVPGPVSGLSVRNQ